MKLHDVQNTPFNLAVTKAVANVVKSGSARIMSSKVGSSGTVRLVTTTMDEDGSRRWLALLRVVPR